MKPWGCCWISGGTSEYYENIAYISIKPRSYFSNYYHIPGLFTLLKLLQFRVESRNKWKEENCQAKKNKSHTSEFRLSINDSTAHSAGSSSLINDSCFTINIGKKILSKIFGNQWRAWHKITSTWYFYVRGYDQITIILWRRVFRIFYLVYFYFNVHSYLISKKKTTCDKFV